MKICIQAILRGELFHFVVKVGSFWRAVGRIKAGQSITDVALFFGIHHSVISHLWKLFQTTQAVVRKPVAGHPRVTTPAED